MPQVKGEGLVVPSGVLEAAFSCRFLSPVTRRSIDSLNNPFFARVYRSCIMRSYTGCVIVFEHSLVLLLCPPQPSKFDIYRIGVA